MKNFFKIFVLVLTISTISCFRLQGSWALQSVQGSPSIFQSVNLEFQDVAFRNTSVIQKMTILGCQSYKYLLQVQQNSLFIKYSTLTSETSQSQQSNTNQKQCSENAARMHSIIRNNLQSVFYFQIFGNYLVFLSPSKQILLSFTRNSSPKLKIIRGVWNLYSFKSTQISQRVQIADTEITLCYGKLIAGYVMDGKYGFKTRLLSNDGCNVTDMEKTILSSSFVRRVGKELEVYNGNMDLIMQLGYVDELDLTSADQKRAAQIQNAKKAEEQAAKIQAEAQAKAKAQADAAAKSLAQKSSLSSLSNTKQDLIGQWLPVSVFGIPMQSTPIYFIFTTSQISYNGGCNTFQFQYTVNEATKSIQIGQNKSTSLNCQVNDDGLYVNGFNRIGKYGISVSGNEIRLKIYDSTGKNVVYEMKRNYVAQQSNATQQNNSTVKSGQSQQASVTTTTSNLKTSDTPNPIQPGKYIFLVLARRDLPRKFCTISENKIKYDGCNSIEHSFKITGVNQIKITGGPTTSKTCATNNDDVLLNAFNSVTSFAPGIQAGSLVLKNANGMEVINLSLF